ncbi:helix-turn-helix domain-containing protein, partial [Escherichia coli]|nr:helix-turn-helix domain-containing protein [Escherichia coli]
KITSVEVEDWTPERRFSVVLETATLSEILPTHGIVC